MRNSLSIAVPTSMGCSQNESCKIGMLSPLQDLEVSYRPVELRSCLEQAFTQRQDVYLREVEWHDPR
jgi:hypothetical protein